MYRQNINFLHIRLADTGELIQHVARVPRFPRFAVSADGRVFRLGNRTAEGSRQHGTGWYEVAPYPNHKGYQMVSIWNERTNKTVRVHRLVADAFLVPPPNLLYQIDHLDGNKNNNHVANLRWVTPDENNAAWHWQQNIPAERQALKEVRKCLTEASS